MVYKAIGNYTLCRITPLVLSLTAQINLLRHCEAATFLNQFPQDTYFVALWLPLLIEKCKAKNQILLTQVWVSDVSQDPEGKTGSPEID